MEIVHGLNYQSKSPWYLQTHVKIHLNTFVVTRYQTCKWFMTTFHYILLMDNKFSQYLNNGKKRIKPINIMFNI